MLVGELAEGGITGSMDEAQAPPTPPTVTRVHEVSPALAHAIFGGGPPWVRDFANGAYEWRRLFAELVGTFFLLLVAAGGGVVNALTPGGLGRASLVVAPGLMVMAVILAIGAISGAHLNPVVSVAFALRREFPWRRVPLYVVAQVVGGVLACLFLWATLGRAGMLGATVPGAGVNDLHATVIEGVLTFGLLTTILGTASGAQNVGPLSAVAVAGYIALAGLWSSPLTGASMNPVRSLSPDVVLGDYSHLWVYIVGPTAGMLVAVVVAIALRGRGGDATATRAAQGSIGTIVIETSRPAEGPTGSGDPTRES